jgi:hypothetical protein
MIFPTHVMAPVTVVSYRTYEFLYANLLKKRVPLFGMQSFVTTENTSKHAHVVSPADHPSHPLKCFLLILIFF